MTDAKRGDPYLLLSQAHPILAHVNKETMPDYMVFMTAWLLHHEIVRDDAIYHDDLIEPLSHEIGQAILNFFPELDGREVINYCTLRAYCMDRALMQRDPIIDQIVIVGGGLDTRAFRIDGIEKCAVYDLQKNADVMLYEEHVLTERGIPIKARSRRVILTELTNASWKDALVAAGFDPNKPTFWIVESTLHFLSPEHVEQLMNNINDMSAPRSQLLTERLIGGGIDLELDGEDQVSMLVFTGLRNGEDGGIFHNLAWKVELLMRRNRACQYYGTMWDPVRLNRFRVPPEEASLGPWFIPLLSKPE